jgi:hypothetical protein
MDINMLNIPNETILFDLHYGGRAPSESEDNNSQDQNKLLPVNEGTPCFRNIFIKNITCNGARRAMYFNGLPEMNLKNISVENSIFKAAGGADLRESDGINMENVIIDVKSGPIVKLYNVKNRIRVI